MRKGQFIRLQGLRGITDGFLLAGEALGRHDHLLQLLDIVFELDIDHAIANRHDGGLHSDESDGQRRVAGNIVEHELTLGTRRGTVGGARYNDKCSRNRITERITDSTSHLNVLRKKRSRHRKQKACNE